MRTVISGFVVVVLAATVATYFRYHSFDPCNWMAQDMAHHSGMPIVMMETRVKANFLMQGITRPGPSECVWAWWKERADEAKNMVSK